MDTDCVSYESYPCTHLPGDDVVPTSTVHDQLNTIADQLAQLHEQHADERSAHPRELDLLGQLATFAQCAAERIAGTTVINYRSAPAGSFVLGDVIISPGGGPSRGELVEDITSTPDGLITLYTDQHRAGWESDPHTQVHVRDETADPAPSAAHVPVVELVMTDGLRYCPRHVLQREIAQGRLDPDEIVTAVSVGSGVPVELTT